MGEHCYTNAMRPTPPPAAGRYDWGASRLSTSITASSTPPGRHPNLAIANHEKHNRPDAATFEAAIKDVADRRNQRR